MCCCVWCGGRLMEGLVRQLGQPKVVVSSSSSDYWCCFLIRWPSKIVTLGLLSHHLQPRRTMFMTRCSSLSLELVYQPYLALGYAFAKKNCDDGGVDDDAIFARTASLIPRKGTNPKDIFHRLLSMTGTRLQDCPFLEKQSCRNAKSK